MRFYFRKHPSSTSGRASYTVYVLDSKGDKLWVGDDEWGLTEAEFQSLSEQVHAEGGLMVEA